MPGLFPSGTTFPSDTTFPGQPRTVWHLLYVSFDPVATPWADRTWTDLTPRLRSWDVGGGRQSRLDGFDASTATYILSDLDRQLDPTNAASALAPLPNRLVWHRVQVAGRTYPVFFGYSVAWNPEWHDGGVGDRWAKLTCSDGRKRLNEIELPYALLDVAEWSELLAALDPSYHYRLGERAGTKLVGHSRFIKFKKKKRERTGKRGRRKRWKTRETRADVTGVSGPSGTYRNTPLLAQPGAIKGDSDTAVEFRSAQSENAIIPLQADDFRNVSELTFGCWVKPTALSASDIMSYMLGPVTTNAPDPDVPIFEIGHKPTGSQNTSYIAIRGVEPPGPALTVGQWALLIGTWAASDTIVAYYLNGALVVAGAGPASLPNAHTARITLGGDSTFGFTDCVLDEPFVIERRLTADQVAAIWDAGPLGFDGHPTGHRIGHVLDLVGEFPAWDVQTGIRTMPPARYAGLAPAQLIDEAEGAEGIPSATFFRKDGRPAFLAADYRDHAPYDTPAFTFGGGSDPLPAQTIHLTDQDANLYNEIRGTIEGGDQTVVARDQASIDEYGLRVLSVDLPLSDTAEAQAYVDAVLARHKDPFVAIDRFTVSGKNDALLDAILTVDLGDCIGVVANTPGGGDPLDQDSYVERRKLAQANVGAPVIGEFAISPR